MAAILSLFSPASSGWTTDRSSNHSKRTVFSCDFQSSHDLNADRQPDGWRRRRDRVHPAYTTAEIVSRDPEMAMQARNLQLQLSRAYQAWKTGKWDDQYIPETVPPFLTALMDGVAIRNCYEIKIDGGAFELVSPAFKVDPRLSYRLSAEMSCRNLDSYMATIELHVLRSNGELVEVFSSPNVTGTRDWHAVESKVISLSVGSEPLLGEVHIRVRPLRGGPASGNVAIDNIEVCELPRITLESDLPFNLAKSGVPFNVTFHVIGQNSPVDAATFSLVDVDDRTVLQQRIPVERTEVSRDSDSRLVSLNSTSPRPAGQRKTLRASKNHNWTSITAGYRCYVEQPGYYRIRMEIEDQIYSEMPLSVLDGCAIQRGSFGWTLTDLDLVLNNSNLSELISRLGVGLVKLPVWVDYREDTRLDALGRMIAEFRVNDIATIGVMDRPLGSIDGTVKEDFERLHPSATLSNSRVWFDSVEPVLTSIGMKLDWLQIGNDVDHSTVGYSTFCKQIDNIRNQIHAIGQDLKIAIGRDSREVIEPASLHVQPSTVAWQAIHFTSQPRLTESELLEEAKKWKSLGAQTWTSTVPLSATGYSLVQRVQDFVQQMTAIRRSEVNAAFMNHLFDDEYGLLDTNHKTGPLLLPWTYLADATAGRQYIGSIELSNRSENHIFDGEHGTVAILWSEQPVTEQVFLGPEIQVKDIWGRPVPIQPLVYPSGSVASQLLVGQWPLIVSNVDKNLVRWQQKFELNSQHLSSQIGDKGVLPITIQNTLSCPAEVAVAVFASSLFEVGSSHKTVTMPTGHSQELNLTYDFLPDASAGNHPVEFAFHVQGDREYRFSIHREVMLGHQDIELLWNMERLSDEIVEMQVKVINNTPTPVSFDCKLFPRGAAYQRVLIVDADKGSTLHTRRVQIAKDKVSGDSPLWVRCEHVGSSLVLNYRLNE